MSYDAYSSQHNSPFPFLESVSSPSSLSPSTSYHQRAPARYPEPSSSSSSSRSPPGSMTAQGNGFSTESLALQLPQFIYAGAPALVPGGGVEVLPPAMLNHSTWLVNNGFAPRSSMLGEQLDGYKATSSPSSSRQAHQPIQMHEHNLHQQQRYRQDRQPQHHIAHYRRDSFDFEGYPMPLTNSPRSHHARARAPTQPLLPNPSVVLSSGQPPLGMDSASAFIDHRSLGPGASSHEPHVLSNDEIGVNSPFITDDSTFGAANEIHAPAVLPPVPASSSSSSTPPTVSSLQQQQPAATTLGLPVYSASGFDLLTVLARVATRPHPRVNLGPVDSTCSFVVVDTRRHDHPIIYCSPNFCTLTGYSESEVLGRNCRFLQVPGGALEPGGQRPDEASQGAASYLKKCLSADKECQSVITNYRKDGTAFQNLVTVVPVTGGGSGNGYGGGAEDEVIFHVGFQIDLTEQPNAILERLRNGSYVIDYSSVSGPFSTSTSTSSNLAGANGVNGSANVKGSGSGSVAGRDGRTSKALSLPPILMSKDLKRLLANGSFLRSIPLTTHTNFNGSTSSSSNGMEISSNSAGNHPLHLMLLELCPDFIHVVSLKGAFLYVSPGVKNVLGYGPEELIGMSLADLAHKEDVVPLMRELKESSAGVGGGTDLAGIGGAVVGSVGGGGGPRTVDLLFRARTKTGVWVWVECRGRLHVEPGKGRKAIILAGRAREMCRITFDTLSLSGGLAKPLKVKNTTNADGGVETVEIQQEFWGTLSDSYIILFVGAGIRDVLGWAPEEVRGRPIANLMQGPQTGGRTQMRKRDGGVVEVYLRVFNQGSPQHQQALLPKGVIRAPLLFQARVVGAQTYPFPRGEAGTANLYEQLDVGRASSWQYELQQLRFANKRLRDEIKALEAAVAAQKRRGAKRNWGSLG